MGLNVKCLEICLSIYYIVICTNSVLVIFSQREIYMGKNILYLKKYLKKW